MADYRPHTVVVEDEVTQRQLLVESLDLHDDWNIDLKNRRDPSAHRIPTSSEGQKAAQREIVTASDARRQRILISQSQVNLLKWSLLFMQALCALVAIAMVHSDNRLASIIAMGIFAT
jgi:hypothetical protein